ncbi:MAG TPA: DUF3606 domain-containing protein [Bacteroidia bacterium]
MPYDIKIKSPDERAKVSVNSIGDIMYWTDVFGCSEKELKEAVKVIGNSIDEVRIYLRAK